MLVAKSERKTGGMPYDKLADLYESKEDSLNNHKEILNCFDNSSSSTVLSDKQYNFVFDAWHRSQKFETHGSEALLNAYNNEEEVTKDFKKSTYGSETQDMHRILPPIGFEQSNSYNKSKSISQANMLAVKDFLGRSNDHKTTTKEPSNLRYLLDERKTISFCDILKHLGSNDNKKGTITSEAIDETSCIDRNSPNLCINENFIDKEIRNKNSQFKKQVSSSSIRNTDPTDNAYGSKQKDDRLESLNFDLKNFVLAGVNDSSETVCDAQNSNFYDYITDNKTEDLRNSIPKNNYSKSNLNVPISYDYPFNKQLNNFGWNDEVVPVLNNGFCNDNFEASKGVFGSNLFNDTNSGSHQRLDTTNLYLTGFGANFTYSDLEILLEDFKPIMSYRIINGHTDYGIAFARLKTPDLARKAVQVLNGKWLQNSKKLLRVKLANKQLPRSGSSTKIGSNYSQTLSQITINLKNSYNSVFKEEGERNLIS
ncbi:MAG: RNA-binding motif, single-stranded-interacting protein 1 [Paramarteilia canceri]